MSGIGDVLYDYNGWVNGSTTWFGFRGRPDELGEFFGRIQHGLTDLPVDRLDAEIGVLGAEDARRPGSIAGRCLGTGVFSSAPDANSNPIRPLIYTGLSIVVTLALRDRVRILWASRRRPAG